MADDFYPFVDSGDPAPDNAHLNGTATSAGLDAQAPAENSYTTRIAVYDDMLSTPRVVVITQNDVRAYLEEVTNTVYRCMKEQGGNISLMVIREIVENFIHARFMEPIISVLDAGSTIRFADQGPGIADKERAFDFGVTSADREQKRYIRGTGAGFPMVQQYLENAGGAISIEDNLNKGTVITVSVDPTRVAEIEAASARGAAVRSGHPAVSANVGQHVQPAPFNQQTAPQQPVQPYGAAPQGQIAPEGPAGAQDGMQRAADTAAAQYDASSAYQDYGEGAQQSPYGAAWQNGQAAGSYQQQGWGAAAGGPGAAGTGMPAAVPSPWGQQYPQQIQQPPQQYANQYPPQFQQPYAQGYPYPGYPQQMAQIPPMGMGYMPAQTPYPTYPQGMGQMGQPQPQVNSGMPYINERGREALQYLATYEMCGPTDLTAAYGHSNATWSRELNALTAAGLVAKHGQKRILTDMGRYWLQENQ